jgi:hypothetical protein
MKYTILVEVVTWRLNNFVTAIDSHEFVIIYSLNI